jgi:putative aminopeptidase FrvX
MPPDSLVSFTTYSKLKRAEFQSKLNGTHHRGSIRLVLSGDIKGGAGPDLTVAPAVHNNLLRMIIETAREKGIPYQMSASSRVTGTDTDAFAYSNGGVPSALISLPLKYMHTTVEMIAKDDMNAVIDLIYQTLLKVKGNEDWRYFS